MGFIKSVTFILWLLPYIFFGQVEQENSKYYGWFDQVIGPENTGLYNGKQYVDLYINRIVDNKHAYFYSNEPVSGSVTYDGQTYYNVNMRYNLETDQLLIHLKPGSVASILQLIYDRINRFTINDFRFVKVKSSYEDGSGINGFHMVLVENANFLLLKRHTKSKARGTKQIVGDRLQYEFISKTKYVLYNNSMYSDIESKADIIENFPWIKNEIKQFYKTYKPLLKRNPDTFMQRLFTEIIEPSSSKNVP